MSVSDFAHHPARSIAATVRHLAETLHSYRLKRAVYSRVFGELSALSDRDLADISIARSDIHDIAEDAAARGV